MTALYIVAVVGYMPLAGVLPMLLRPFLLKRQRPHDV